MKQPGAMKINNFGKRYKDYTRALKNNAQEKSEASSSIATVANNSKLTEKE